MAPHDICRGHNALRFFEFLGMPLGLKNATQTMQCTINHLLRNLPFVRAYQDEISIFSDNHDQNERLLGAAVRNATPKPRINWSKCQFNLPEVVFAGFSINRESFRRSPPKTRAIIDFPKPIDSLQLRRFFGMINYYRHHIPHAVQCKGPV